MPSTYEPIATTTLGTATTTITFSSIPATYTDLRLVFTTLSSTTNTQFVQVNNDTATNYSLTALYGNGSTAQSYSATSAVRWDVASDVVNGSSTIPFLIEMDFFSYAGSTNKTVLIRSSEDLNGSGVTMSRVGLYRSTSAINRIDIRRAAGNYNIGTTATLYGIKNF